MGTSDFPGVTAGDVKEPWFNPWVWRRAWQPTPVNVLKALEWKQNGTEFISFTLNKDMNRKSSDPDHRL